ncbi:MAG TPA: (2Fe-2S) ferredoxin domain-containing protein [Planctomycetota bacterium]|nr:(2Fe-2S) ferredoxin domain-containing protein [Planctomycetota bacterium]
MNSQHPYLAKHILICAGESCAPQGGEKVREELKKELRARGIRQLYRDGQCTCLGLCRDGVNAVIWPEGTYLAGLTEQDIPRLVDYIEGKGPRVQDREVHAAQKIEIKRAAAK